MSYRGRLLVLMVSGAIAAYAVIGGMPVINRLLSVSAQQQVSDASAQLRIVESVLRHIQNDYVDEPDMEKVRLGALRGLAGGLDPYSSYLTADQVRAFETGKSPNKVGIGIDVSQISGWLYVVAPIKGGPADVAGIKAGDVIEYIDGKASRDISLYDAKQMILGDAGTTVSLRVLRAGEKAQTIKVARAAHKYPAAESRVEAGRIGVVKVFSLDTGAAEDIRTHLAGFSKQGVRKVVLDLRGVSSGPISEGAAVANLFIRSGEVAKIVGREGKVVTSFAAEPGKHAFDGTLAILTDYGTAGAAEVVSAAVLESKRGEVIGEKTFGAGTDQKLFTMSGGGGYLLTVAKWAAPSGTPFLGEDRATTGIKPSIEVKRPDTPDPLDLESLGEPTEGQPQASPTATPTPKPQPKVQEDLQLKKALEVLGGAAVKAAG